jgi:hypothetical protein
MIGFFRFTFKGTVIGKNTLLKPYVAVHCTAVYSKIHQIRENGFTSQATLFEKSWFLNGRF